MSNTAQGIKLLQEVAKSTTYNQINPYHEEMVREMEKVLAGYQYRAMHPWLSDIKEHMLMIKGKTKLHHDINECDTCGKARLQQLHYKETVGRLR